MSKGRLGDYTSIKTGKLDANASTENGLYPFFTCSSKTLRINDYAYDCECVLVAGNGDLNVKYYNGKFNAYQRTYIIESNEKQILDTKYMYYLINSKIEQLRKNSIGGVIKYIKLNNLTDLDFEIIDLCEQIEIVKKLDSLQDIIQRRKNQLNDFKSLLENKFIEMFGNPVLNEKQWKTDLLGNLGFFKNGMNFRRTDNGYQIRCLGVGNFNNGNIIDNAELLDIINLNEKPTKEYLLENKDIVFVRSNGSKELVGRSTLIENIKDEITYSGFCIRYRNQNEILDTRFLIELFQNKYFFDYLKKDSRGANINNINQQILSNLKIIIPPLEEQKKFIDFVKNISNQKYKIEENLKKLEDLQINLMNKYFN